MGLNNMIYQEYLTPNGNTDGVHKLRLSKKDEIKWEIRYMNTIIDIIQCLDVYWGDYLDIDPIYSDESSLSLVSFRTSIRSGNSLEFIQISKSQFNILNAVVGVD